jgi:hypothetical protein
VAYPLTAAKRPVDVEIDPVVVPINDEPGTDSRDWIAGRTSVESVDIGGTAADIIRDIREHGEH